MSLLRIEDLTIHFPTEEGDVRAVNGVSLSVEAGQTPRFSRMLQMVEEPQPYTSLKVLFLFTPSPCRAR